MKDQPDEFYVKPSSSWGDRDLIDTVTANDTTEVQSYLQPKVILPRDDLVDKAIEEMEEKKQANTNEEFIERRNQAELWMGRHVFSQFMTFIDLSTEQSHNLADLWGAYYLEMVSFFGRDIIKAMRRPHHLSSFKLKCLFSSPYLYGVKTCDLFEPRYQFIYVVNYQRHPTSNHPHAPVKPDLSEPFEPIGEVSLGLESAFLTTKVLSEALQEHLKMLIFEVVTGVPHDLNISKKQLSFWKPYYRIVIPGKEWPETYCTLVADNAVLTLYDHLDKLIDNPPATLNL